MGATSYSGAEPQLGAQRLSSSRTFPVMVVVAAGMALFTINEYGTSSAMPDVVKDIGGGQYFSWATSIFVLASVVSSVFVPQLLARWGVKKSYLFTAFLFLVGSLLCASAPWYVLFIAGRTCQGFGGGLTSALAYATVSAVLPQALWRSGILLISLMWTLGMIVGPMLGGLTSQLLSWRWNFVILTGVALLLLILISLVLPSATVSSEKSSAPIPLVSVSILALTVLIVSEASVVGQMWLALLLLVVATLIVVAWIGFDRRSVASVLPKVTWRPGSFLPWIYLLLSALGAASNIIIFMPKFAQEIGHANATVAGFVGSVLALGWTLGQIVSNKVTNSRVVAWLCVFSPLVMTAGLGIAFAGERCSHDGVLIWVWIGALLLYGSGIGSLWSHMAAMIMGSVPSDIADGAQEKSKAASSLTTLQLLSNAWGAALAGLLVNFAPHSSVSEFHVLIAGFGVITLLGAVVGVKAMRTYGYYGS